MELLRRREQGQLAVDGRALTHRPAAYLGATAGDLGLASRLQPGPQLPAAGAQLVARWDGDAGRLLSAGEDCRLRIWGGDGSELVQAVDTVRAVAQRGGAWAGPVRCCWPAAWRAGAAAAAASPGTTGDPPAARTWCRATPRASWPRSSCPAPATTS